MDRPQAFWDAFRRRWRNRLGTWAEMCRNMSSSQVTPAWTEMIKKAAEEACDDFAKQCGADVIIGRERHGRLDVFAEDRRSSKLVVAFESELAYWGYKGGIKDWRQEFPKLCDKKADLRVLVSTFEPGTGNIFEKFLAEKISSMKACFDRGAPGDFCLIFGPEDTRRDPRQCWLAYSLERDLILRPLASAKLLHPRLVITGEEPCTE